MYTMLGEDIQLEVFCLYSSSESRVFEIWRRFNKTEADSARHEETL